MGSASYSDFEIPNTPGLQNDPGNFSAPGGAPWSSGGGLPATFDSSLLNENQNEQNYYGVVAYQKSEGPFNAQVSAYGRYSGVHFRPDTIGDLFYSGVASDVSRDLYSGGFQADASYELGDNHTLRGGMMFLDEYHLVGHDHDSVSDGPCNLQPCAWRGAGFQGGQHRLPRTVRRDLLAGRMEDRAQGHAQLRGAL